MKKLLLLAVVLVVCSSVTFGFDPMGPPVAGLQEGQWSAGAEYSWSKMNIKAIHGRYTGMGPEAMAAYDIRGMEMQKFYGNIGYGISNKWEAFLRLGVASDDADLGGCWGDHYSGEFNTDSAFAFGCGTKMTLHESNADLKWGALAQVSWTNPDGKVRTDYPIEGDLELRFIEVQLAVGPTYRVTEGVWIYGGPFIHFIDGEMNVRETSIDGSPSDDKASYDLEEEANYGGYVGLQLECTEDVSICFEWMHTDEADGFGFCGIWRIQ